MQVVIKIDEARFKDIQRIAEVQLDMRTDTVEQLIAKGTPLPKGHGRLIDVNDLLDDINLEDNDYNRDVNTGEIITLENIDRIPTIIKADKAESEEL